MRPKRFRSPNPRRPLEPLEEAASDAATRARRAAERASIPTEEDAHRRIVAELRRAALVTVVHIPNGSVATPGYRRKLAALGLCPGASDLLLLGPGWIGFLELKRAKGGRVSADQRVFLAKAEAAGARAVVAKGIDEAREICKEWGALP